MKNGRLGPILIDSLDQPNAAVTRNKIPKKQKEYASFYLVLACGAVFLCGLFFAFCLYRLSIESAHNMLAYMLLWAMYITTACVFILLSIGGSTALIRWLHGWADKSNLVTLLDGPHIRATDIQSVSYDVLFASLADKMYAVALQSAAESTYHGVQTLSLDKSISQSGAVLKSDQTQKAQHDHTSDHAQEMYFDVALLDRLNRKE